LRRQGCHWLLVSKKERLTKTSKIWLRQATGTKKKIYSTSEGQCALLLDRRFVKGPHVERFQIGKQGLSGRDQTGEKSLMVKAKGEKPARLISCSNARTIGTHLRQSGHTKRGSLAEKEGRKKSMFGKEQRRGKAKHEKKKTRAAKNL